MQGQLVGNVQNNNVVKNRQFNLRDYSQKFDIHIWRV